MKYTVCLLLVGLCFSCSSHKKKTQSAYEYDAEKGTGIPEWVYSPVEACDSKAYICASSEGNDLKSADLNAKNALASILEVNISSHFELKKFGLTSLESQGLTETVSQSTKEQLKIILNGVTIKNRFVKDKAHFSFAVLAKKPAGKILRSKLKNIDDQLVSFYKRKSAVFVKKMLALLETRNVLEKQLTALTGKRKQAPLGYEQIYQLKLNQLQKDPIFVKTVSAVPAYVKNNVEALFTQMGYKISNNQRNISLAIKFEISKSYLNVKGFQKYAANLTLTSFSKMGIKLGVLYLEESVSARSKEDATQRVMQRIKEQVTNSIHKLNIN